MDYKIQLEKRVKKLDDDLYEIRAKTPDKLIRSIYFQIQNNQYFITHGFIKKQQKTPRREIDKAKNIKSKKKW